LNFNEQGFNNGELDNSLKERTFQFNKDGEDQRINFKILDATFRYNRYIELLVDMDWPALSTKLESVNGLQLYGNYDIGFGSPGGSLSLPNRVLGNAYNYNITSKAIGASRECNIYGFGLAVDIVLGDDIASTKGSSGTNIYSVCENKMLLCNKPSNNLNNINNKETIESIDYNANNINTNVFDIATYIIKTKGIMTTMKLQKLVYYCQAWSLVWDEKPLFSEPIEAWSNGPVVPALFEKHRGSYRVSSIPDGDDSKLTAEQIETINKVLEHYGDKPANWLIELTHLEAPWRNARKGLHQLERGGNIIAHDEIAEYYSSL